MKTKYFFLAALAGMTLASCSDDVFVGDNSPNVVEETNVSEAIGFGSGFRAVTRANEHVGADAAALLGNNFIVSGFKGAATQATTTVFDNYLVQWEANSAGKTESNTCDWEYVGKTSPVTGSTLGTQTIKYWDFSQALYDFIAYSPGNNTVDITGTTPASGHVLVTPINAGTVASAAYTIKGGETELTKCFIADRVTVLKANYKKDVVLNFRALAAKVRVGIYETVPGYSVKDVKFYTADAATTAAITTGASATSATLIGPFNTGGLYTVTFKSGDQKAYTSITNTGYTPDTYRQFGDLTYGPKERNEKGTYDSGTDTWDNTAEIYLKRSASTPSYANNGVFTTVLPVEDASSVYELCVDYTLEAIDGGEEIIVHGAKAYVPATYTQWLPKYAYTYIFKISDNSNGWTNTDMSDPEGLYPITFDAIVTDSEELNQSTITTVATPSITAYQNGRSLSANEFAQATADIYVQVMNGSTLVTDLKDTGKSFFYKLSADKTEADVMDALNVRASEAGDVITGRNGLVLTPATDDYTVTEIPRADGNNITVNEGEAGKLSPDAAGTYAFVYDYTTGSPTVTYVYTAGQLTGSSAPGDFTTKYFMKNVDGTFRACVAGDYTDGNYYYTRFSNINHNYAVKVIKVQ